MQIHMRCVLLRTPFLLFHLQFSATLRLLAPCEAHLPDLQAQELQGLRPLLQVLRHVTG